MKNFNRGDFNSLNNLKKEKNITKPNKLKSIGKLLVNKIDDILGQYPSSSNNLNSYSDVYATSKNIIDNINENMNYLPTEFKSENNNNKNNRAKDVESLNSEFKDKITIKPKNEKKKKVPKIPIKDTFMTYIDIDESNIEKKPTSKYIEEHDKKIKETMNEIEDIDKFLNDDEEIEYLKENPEHMEDVRYFKNLISEVDSYRKNIKDEYDELQYLIKFVDQTKGRINRHKYGVANMFTQTGLKPLGHKLEYSDNSDEDQASYTKEGVYDKTKNLSKVKDKLFNLQGNVLNFYQNFNTNMKEVEKNNKDYKIVNKEFKDKIVRATTSGPRLRTKSKPK